MLAKPEMELIFTIVLIINRFGPNVKYLDNGERYDDELKRCWIGNQ